MRKKSVLFGVDELDASNEFSDPWYAPRVFGLGKFGIPWIPAIGQTSYSKISKPSQWHVHNGCIELIYCNSGLCEYESCGARFKFSPGRVFVSRSDEPHRQIGNPKGYSTYYLLFKPTPDRDVRWFGEQLSRLPRLFKAGSSVRSHFCRILHLVEAAGGKPTRGQSIRLRTEVLSLLLAFIDSTTLPMERKRTAVFAQIAEEMRRHPEDDYPLKTLAARSEMSTSSFIEGFKGETGFSPHTYLLNCRVEQAKADLRNGLSVKSVADRLGFPSSQHLSTTFRKIVGLAPGQWLKGESM